jgi:integrase
VLPERQDDSAMRLDNRTIGRLPLPEDKHKNDVIYFDETVSGFGIRLRGSGDDGIHATWVCQYRSHGRTRRMKVGSVGKLSLDQARTAARKILARVELGHDPAREKATARLKQAHTLKSIAESYLAARTDELRPASYRVTKLYLLGKAYFGPLHSTTVGEITRADVAARIGAIARNSGTVTAGRARSAVSSLFAWAMGEGLCENNPVIGTNKPPDSTPRDRVLEDSELAAIWNACKDDDHGRIVRLLALTGARRAEIGGLCWSELDLEKGLWSLPKERAKNRRTLVLPLPRLALSIIESVPERVGRDHLFGERAASGFTHWGASKQELDKCLVGKVAEWKLHDLRRTCATRLADLGTQPHVIESILNHYGGFRSGVSGTYNRSPYEREMRAALGMWADHVRALAEGGERKVVAFPQDGA